MSPIDTTAPAQERSPGSSRTHLSCRLQPLPSPHASVTVLALTGELDISTEAHVATALHAALDQVSGPLVVDVAGLGFCSAGGLGLLVSPTGTAAGHPYVLAGLSRYLDRIVGVLWPEGMAARYPCTADAVAALHVRHAPDPGAGSRGPRHYSCAPRQSSG